MVGCERGLIKVYTNSDFKLLFELQEQKVRSADYEDVQVVYTHAYLSPPPPPPPPGLYHLPGVLRGWRVAGQWFLGWVPLLVEG